MRLGPENAQKLARHEDVCDARPMTAPARHPGSLRALTQTFGRRGPSIRGAAAYLGAAGDTPATDPNCSAKTYLETAPVGTDGKPGMSNRTKDLLILGGTTIAGAVAGALIPGKHRVRNGSIGAVAGIAAGVGIDYYGFKSWKDAGGASKTAGACTPTPSK